MNHRIRDNYSKNEARNIPTPINSYDCPDNGFLTLTMQVGSFFVEETPFLISP